MKNIYVVSQFSFAYIDYLKEARREHLKDIRNPKNLTREERLEEHRKFKELRKNPTIPYLQERIKRIINCCDRPRNLGYFTSVNDAQTAILNNGHLFEGWYYVVCIEEVPFGHLDVGFDTEVKGWYQYDKTTENYKKIKTPAWSLGTFGWST